MGLFDRHTYVLKCKYERNDLFTSGELDIQGKLWHVPLFKVPRFGKPFLFYHYINFIKFCCSKILEQVRSNVLSFQVFPFLMREKHHCLLQLDVTLFSLQPSMVQPSHLYLDTVFAILALGLFIVPLYASVYFILSFDTSHPRHRHALQSLDLEGVQDEQIHAFHTLHIQYWDFRLKEPNFIDPSDRDVFYLHRDNMELLEKRPGKLLHGVIEVITNGSVNSAIECGWQTNASHFRVRPRRVRQHYPVLCPLLVPNANSFQHFLDGVLPKLAQLQASAAFSGVTYLIHRPWDRNIYDIIKLIDMRNNSIAFYDGGYITSDYLINTCTTPPLHPRLFEQVRDMLSYGYKQSVSTNDRSVILLTRGGARNGGRTMLNNNAVVNFLRQRYGNMLIIFRGNLPFSESVSLFGGAKLVIGVHGGAFYNILLARSKLHVVEIMPVTDKGDVVPSYLGHTIIWSIADMLNHTYWRLNATPQNKLGSVVVDIVKLANILDKVDFQGTRTIY